MNNTQPKLVQKFDSSTLELMAAFAISNSRSIKKVDLQSLREIVKRIDKNDYKDKRIDTIQFIEKALEARLDHGLNDKRLVASYIRGGLLQDDFPVDINSFMELTDDEFRWISETIRETLTFNCIEENSKPLMEMLSNYQAGEYRNNKAKALEDFNNLITKSHNDIRKMEMDGDDIEDEFIISNSRVSDPTFISYYQKANNPTNKLYTGMKGLNYMLNGGFESGRTYLLVGLPGEGKSMTLLDLALQICRYNKDAKPKDPTKKLAVLMFSMENTSIETFNRIWNMMVSSDDIIRHSQEDVLEETSKVLTGNIEFIFKYKPSFSCTTDYIYDLCEKYEQKGYEILAIFMDYVKVIKPSNYNPELRIALGNIIEEFKVIAKRKDVPVITATQLNRDASKHIDEGRRTNKNDLVLLLGRENIGESTLMLENIDAAFVIASEIDYMTGLSYLGFLRIKARYKTEGMAQNSHIYQQYDPFYKIKLMEDYYAIENYYKESMKPPVQMNGMQQAQTINNPASIANINQMDAMEATNSELYNILKPV